MPTLHGNLTDTAIDLKVGLVDSTGTAAPLTLGESYLVQNTGEGYVYISENTAAPADLAGPWHRLPKDADKTIEAGSEPIWARTDSGRSGRVVVTEAQ